MSNAPDQRNKKDQRDTGNQPSQGDSAAPASEQPEPPAPQPLVHPEPLVRRGHDRGIATLTLDSPHNRNALSARLVTELLAGLRAAAADPNTRAVLLSHTGNTFCAGADLSEAVSAGGTGPAGGAAPVGAAVPAGSAGGAVPAGGAAADAAVPVAGPLGLAHLMRTIVELPVPVVARVTGHVRAGGLGLLGACDISAAGDAASFAFTEARLGLAPAVISMPLLPRLDPRAAGRYYLTGERFDAAEAARIGLVTLAGDPDQVLAPVLDGLRRGSPQGLAESKRLATAEVVRAFDRDTAALARQSARLFGSAEAREGMTAFLERRDPAWAVAATAHEPATPQTPPAASATPPAPPHAAPPAASATSPAAPASQPTASVPQASVSATTAEESR
ncbi:enoyl-CoA hydratase [Streptomyces zagrosensis]|uniref:Enoyl-CoA hydratase n=1 Tax=Streptomyces zagrosensis TaxID=1042984 RepID=A0A7W9UX91_9ACTN|nr:enoyl-CoA hydratase-related protein [Streptomyces zagrosensis]MBB5934653.1 enoyl-CoA hydratase [Streptomyces zagrosensis]